MAKRFTDSLKWRNPWFRQLPDRAKLCWVYLCDECDHCGVWKVDFELASFQLNFRISGKSLNAWFGRKIHFFDADKILIVQFYEFQYSGVKDSWSAKSSAREKLLSLGFQIENNKVIGQASNHLGAMSPHLSTHGNTTLIIDIDNIKDIIPESELKESDYEAAYKSYPRKRGKEEGLKKLRSTIKTRAAMDEFMYASKRYADDCRLNGTLPKHIKHFSTFVNSDWREWLDPETGTATAIQAQLGGFSELIK